MLSTDSEVFQYDGKLDFKITNSNNRYDIIAGEFKIWSGTKSFNECLMQATEKHVNGSEKVIYMIFINKNKNVRETYQKILKLLFNTKVYIEQINDNLAFARNQFFSSHLVDINSFKTTLVVGVINLYYKKV